MTCFLCSDWLVTFNSDLWLAHLPGPQQESRTHQGGPWRWLLDVSRATGYLVGLLISGMIEVNITRYLSCVTYHALHVRHALQITRYIPRCISHVTYRFTCHARRYKSRFTGHALHITRYILRVTYNALHITRHISRISSRTLVFRINITLSLPLFICPGRWYKWRREEVWGHTSISHPEPRSWGGLPPLR